MAARKQRVLGVMMVATLTALAIPGAAESADPPTLGRTVPAAQQVAMDRIDHSAWTALLRRYVDGEGRVNYAAWKALTADRKALNGYLRLLSTASLEIPARREGQLAYWINAYNAVTIEGILREYPTSSIRNHTAKLFGYNIWEDLPLVVGGKQISLDQMEHQILRKLGESRIHFAIVCASRGCPRLLNEAFTADQLDRQLSANARDFFASSTNFRSDVNKQTIQLSAILDWFSDDFGPDQEARLRAIAPYLPNEAARELALNQGVRVSYLEYDWSLNEQPPVAAAP